MLKIKKLKFLSILFSALLILSFSFTSNANASPLSDRNVLNTIQDFDAIQVKDLTTNSEKTILKSQYTKNTKSKSILTEESTEAYIPNKLNNMISPKVIIGDDDRYQISDTRYFPYSAICYIQITYPNESTYIGTAWMYGDNVAITAGHCVYSADDGGWATSIIVIPGMNGDSMPYDYTWATSISAPQGYTKFNLSGYDWGVIELNANIGRDTGYFGAYWTTSSLTGSNVDVTGYPGEKDGTMWKMNGNITNSTLLQLSYTIDTTGGQSGCPVYWKDSEGTRAVAIHTQGSSTSNSGTRITKDMFDYFNTFR